RLIPMAQEHAPALRDAAADGNLWELRVTSVPPPGSEGRYIEEGLAGQAAGHMLPFVVIDEATDTIIGSTRYHDIVATVARLEIGYTWYARRHQRTHVNAACKLLLLRHAFHE